MREITRVGTDLANRVIQEASRRCCAQTVHMPGLTSGSGMGGSARDGNILRRRITSAAPQHRHRSWGRGVGVVAGVGAPTGCMNTSNFNSEIQRLLLRCK